MKSSFPIAVLLLTAGLTALAFQVPWSTVDSGGGKSTATTPEGAVFSIQGTAGQWDAAPGVASGGGFSLAGGYWAEAVPTPGGPNLTMQQMPNGAVRFHWDTTAIGWFLEASTDLRSWRRPSTVIANAGFAEYRYWEDRRIFLRLAQP